jgi:hypothetical protein
VLSQAVTEADQKPLLAVNPKAVVERAGKKQVLRVKGDSVEAIDVTIGRSLGEVLEITGPVAAGERVVLNPSEKLHGGSLVTVTSK